MAYRTNGGCSAGMKLGKKGTLVQTYCLLIVVFTGTKRCLKIYCARLLMRYPTCNFNEFTFDNGVCVTQSHDSVTGMMAVEITVMKQDVPCDSHKRLYST